MSNETIGIGDMEAAISVLTYQVPVPLAELFHPQGRQLALSKWRDQRLKDQLPSLGNNRERDFWVVIGGRGHQSIVLCQTEDLATSWEPDFYRFYTTTKKDGGNMPSKATKTKLNITGDSAEEVIELAWSAAVANGMPFKMQFTSSVESVGFKGDREVLVLDISVGDWSGQWKFGQEGIANVMEELSKMLPSEMDE